MSTDVPREAPRTTAQPEAEPARADTEAVARLFESHKPHVYRRALRLLRNPSDAEEATQEVFLRVLRGVQGFEAQSLLSTWLYRITTNYCLNLIRDRSRRAALDEAESFEGADLGPVLRPRPDDLCLLRRLLAAADEQQARAVLYVHLDGLSHDEAAERLGVSRRTVGNLLERFRAWASDEPAPSSLAA